MRGRAFCQEKPSWRSCQVVVEFFVDNSNVFLTEQCVPCLPQTMNQGLRPACSVKRNVWFLENAPVEAALHRFLHHSFCIFTVPFFSGRSFLIFQPEIFSFQLAAFMYTLAWLSFPSPFSLHPIGSRLNRSDSTWLTCPSVQLPGISSVFLLTISSQLFKM